MLLTISVIKIDENLNFSFRGAAIRGLRIEGSFEALYGTEFPSNENVKAHNSSSERLATLRDYQV